MLEGYLVKKMLDASFGVAKDTAKRILNEKGARLTVSRDDIEESLNLHLRFIKNWSGEVDFNDLEEAKSLNDIFVELDLFVYPRRVRISPDETIRSIPLREIFDKSNSHIVLLGQPGAGKTTSMKYLCRLLLQEEEFQKDRFSFPILIKFRDIDGASVTPTSALITDQLFKILGLGVGFPKEMEEKEGEVNSDRQALKEKVIINFLDEFKVLLILDGFDELSQNYDREKAIKEITNYVTHLDFSTLIITSRTGDFKYNIDNTDHYELCPLNKKQIYMFAIRWLKNKRKASDFLKKVNNTPFADTAIRPLTLAHLCAIYERIQDIPEKPKTLYKKIVTLLLEEWDQQRSVKRESRYAHFEVDRKYEFLCHLAYELTKSLQQTAFSTQDLLHVYGEIHEEYGLQRGEAQQVVSEIETHNGLLLQAGFDQYEFAHKSLQEFLAAEFLVKLPSIPNTKTLSYLPNEVAIAIAISSSPSSYFIELVLNRFKEHKFTGGFVRAFLNRLLIEKPNFKSSTLFDLALLIFYSIYIESNVIYGEQPELFYSDLIFKEFEKMVGAFKTKSVGDILKCYKTNHIYEASDGDSIHRLLRVQEIPSNVLLVTHNLPKLLYLRESLLSTHSQ